MAKKKKNKTRTYLIKCAIIVSVFLQFSIYLIQSNGRFFISNYDSLYENYKKTFNASQYVQKKPTAFITDEVFEAYAGGAFLKGLNPIHIVHDHPPLGRYLVALSILLFNNAQTVVLIALLASFLGVFLTSRLILKNFYLSIIPLAIFANEPLTLAKLIYAPLPEPIHLPFIIFSMYFFIKSFNNNMKWKHYILTSILLGFVISIRFFVTGGVLVVAMLTTLIFYKQFGNCIKFAVSLGLSLVVLILSYTRTIMDGYSVFQVFSIQKYILAYHKSAFTNAFSFWDLILFNRWHTWWGEQKIISDPQWIFVWPVSVIANFIGIGFVAYRKIKLKPPETVIFIWIGLYCLMLSTGYTSTRYFFPVLPYLYIMMVWSLTRIYGNLKKNK